jgi:hypothetical protein
VQDGGAVLGFSYHDLMSRLKILGPDNAWERLLEVIRWFDEVQGAGGYRRFYDGSREGTLQGGGTAGGLGLDHEFFESVLVPQIILNGFLGFAPRGDGFALNPNIPSAWPELALDRIRFHNLVLRVRAARGRIEIYKTGQRDEPMFLHLPKGHWRASWSREDGSVLAPAVLSQRADGALEVQWGDASGLRLERQ